MIELRSPHLVSRIDVDRGAEIRHLGRNDVENVLASGDDWTAPLPAARSKTYGGDELDWLSGYRLGWQELFPNAGDPCTVMDVPLPFHGEVSSARWEVLDASATRAVLRTPTRLPLVLERTMTLAPDRAALLIEERVTNESEQPVPCIWGHHPAFAVTASSVLDIPARALHAAGLSETDLAAEEAGTWPHATGVDGSTVDLRLSVLPRRLERLCYLHDLTAGWAAIRDRDRAVGAGLAWDIVTFPHMWLWQDTGTKRFPFYGRTRLTALEPNRAWPADGLAGAIERDQALWIPPGGSHETWITAVVFDATDQPLTGVERDGSIRTA